MKRSRVLNGAQHLQPGKEPNHAAAASRKARFQSLAHQGICRLKKFSILGESAAGARLRGGDCESSMLMTSCVGRVSSTVSSCCCSWLESVMTVTRS